MNNVLKPFKLPLPNPERNYDALDPLDSRYYDPEVSRYLSEHARITYQAYVEAALAHTLAEFGICSKKIATEIEKAARTVQTRDVYKEELVTHHDIKALVNCIRAKLSDEAKPYVHFGATSYDIIATANSLQMQSVIQNVVIPRLRSLLTTLVSLAEKYADSVQIGRTHGQHAVPITFGFAISEYISRLGDSFVALQDLSNHLSGKFSGAVGAYNALGTFIDDPLKFEKSVLSKVGLTPAPYSTQIIPPTAMIRIIDELTIVAGTMANLGHDMRHLQRSEIGEVRERFEKGQAGSSTMAHKRNPWNFENIVSMSKQVIAQTVNANLNLTSEHQRDLTDSASSRFYSIVPACVASMAKRLDAIMTKLEVDEEAMYKNLLFTTGAIAAEPLYLLLEKYGHTTAHEKAKELAHKALEKDSSLVQEIESDPATQKYWLKFTDTEQRVIIEPEKYYIGLASKKTNQITKYWRDYLKK